MSKWVRVDSSNIVQEVISYNPFDTVNESLHPFFHEVFGEESYGWTYDPDTDTFTAPPPIPEPDPEPPLPPTRPPGTIYETEFREALNLLERILWDNPETGTNAQKGAIITIKSEFPHENTESMTEVFQILEQVGFFTPERSEEVRISLT